MFSRRSRKTARRRGLQDPSLEPRPDCLSKTNSNSRGMQICLAFLECYKKKFSPPPLIKIGGPKSRSAEGVGVKLRGGDGFTLNVLKGPLDPPHRHTENPFNEAP